MSFIREELGNNYENLDRVLGSYILALEDYKKNLDIKGKRLEISNREHASWIAYYDERKIELNTYVKFFEMEVKKVRGQLYRKYLENYSISLGERQIEKYIDSDKEYLEIYEKYLSIKELHDTYVSIVNSFIQRGYSLKNITQIRVSSLEDVTL